MGEVVDAAEVARPFLSEIEEEIDRRSIEPTLCGLLTSDHGPSLTYARRTAEVCGDVGIRYEMRRVPRLEIEDAIMEANADPDVHGILVYYPVFGNEQDSYLREIVDLTKDVEGLHARYRYNLYHDIRWLDEESGKKSILPCTPLAILKILEHFAIHDPTAPVGTGLEGRTATVVNRSEIVGRPLAAMLAHDGALVYSCDIDGVQIFRGREVEETDLVTSEVVPKADILVTGVPDPEFRIPTDIVREGAFVVNVAHVENVALDVVSRASRFVPSVGRVTIAMLARNLLRLYDQFHADG